MVVEWGLVGKELGAPMDVWLPLQPHLSFLVGQLVSEIVTALGHYISLVAAAAHFSPLPKTLVIWSSNLHLKMTLHSGERVDSIDLLCHFGGSCYFQGVEYGWEVATTLD